MPQSGGVVSPRARRRRPAPRAFGLDLEWETGTARADREPAHGRFDLPPARGGAPAAQRRVSGPLPRGRTRLDLAELAPEAAEDDAPWFAALPASLLAPADEPMPELDEEPVATRRELVDAGAERARRAERDLVAAELARLARPDTAARPAPPSEPSAEPDSARRPVDRSAAADWAPVYDPVTGRRTVTIRGRGAERPASLALGAPRRARPAAPRHERSGFVGDRAAMWAVLLGVLLVLIAVASTHP